jgi:transcriptional regulator with XRE-family HTH domain
MADASDNVAVAYHASVMHNALQQCKRLLRYGAIYSAAMPTPAARLKRARVRAGFETAKDAAEAMGIAVSTYLGHENGSRGIPAKRASIYARRFHVTEQWLLYGTGRAPGDEVDHAAEIARIVDSLPWTKKQAALAMLRGLEGAD